MTEFGIDSQPLSFLNLNDLAILADLQLISISDPYSLFILLIAAVISVAIMLGAHTKQINAYGKRSRRVVDAPSTSTRTISNVDIISIFDDLPPAPTKTSLANKMKKRENAVPKLASPKVVGLQKKKRLSPVLSPVRQKKLGRVAELKGEELFRQIPKSKSMKSKAKPLGSGNPDDPVVLSVSPPRAPLAAVPVNLSGSPALSSVRKATSRATPRENKLFAPFVDVDIIVLDDNGHTVRTEKRVVKANQQCRPTQLNPFTFNLKSAPIAIPATDSDNEPDDSPIRPRRKAPSKKPIIVSDNSEFDDDYTLSKSKHVAKKDTKVVSQRALSRTNTLVTVEIPPAPYRTQARVPTSKPATTAPISSEDHEIRRPPSPLYIPKDQSRVPAQRYQPLPPRQLTPIKGGRKRLFEPPSPPSPTTPTDFDLSLDFSELNLNDDSQTQPIYQTDFDVPEFLLPLLQECHQETCGPHNFSTFIESFSYDAIFDSVRDKVGVDMQFKKIGEASYSEVFGIGDVVLKVIPLRDETKEAGSLSDEDGPAPSDVKDVRKEIIVTRAMGEVHHGFVKLLKTYVVRGRYPEVLLQLWDEYNERKGSESIRPDTFKVSQVYAIIVLPNGGPDLEAYTFHNVNRVGWRQACSIFWQVAKALSHAEYLVSFEHRDLHWGQILVKNLQVNALRSLNTNQKMKSKGGRVWMDDPSHGIQATVIDLGLSRMDAGDGTSPVRVHWTPFDEEVFMGEGDYQFDVYRMMRELVGDTWADFHPFTNVVWLHYLLRKLLFDKGLKPPSAARKTKATTEMPAPTNESSFSEKDCYDCLVDLESWLGQSIVEQLPTSSLPAVKVKGKKKVQATVKPASFNGPARVGEIIAYGEKKQWIKLTRTF